MDIGLSCSASSRNPAEVTIVAAYISLSPFLVDADPAASGEIHWCIVKAGVIGDADRFTVKAGVAGESFSFTVKAGVAGEVHRFTVKAGVADEAYRFPAMAGVADEAYRIPAMAGVSGECFRVACDPSIACSQGIVTVIDIHVIASAFSRHLLIPCKAHA